MSYPNIKTYNNNYMKKKKLKMEEFSKLIIIFLKISQFI